MRKEFKVWRFDHLCDQVWLGGEICEIYISFKIQQQLSGEDFKMSLLANHHHPVVMRGDVDKTTFLGLFDLTRDSAPTRSGHSTTSALAIR